MRQVAALLLAVALVVAAGYVVFANVLSPVEPSVPTRLTSWVEPARTMSRDRAGPTGWWPLPLRLVQVGCSTDGEQAVLAFDTVLPQSRAYAYIRLGDPTVPSDPGIIGTLSPAEFEDPVQDYAGILSQACH